MTDELADPVQPEEGQGDTGSSDAPYAEYLDRIPEEVRGDVEPIFKEWDANTTKRFQDASEFRKSWEPYEQVGVNQYDPEAVQWALQFFEAQQSNPQAVQEWFQAYAQEHGLEAAQQAAAELEQQPAGDEYGYDPTQQQIEQMLQDRLSPFEQQLQQINQRFQQQEEQQRVAEASAYIDSQLHQLEEKHGDEFNREWVERLVHNYIDSDPQNAVQRAWGDFQSLRNQLEKAALQSKVDAPSAAERGGFPDVAPEKITTFAQAKDIALQHLRNENSA